MLLSTWLPTLPCIAEYCKRHNVNIFIINYLFDVFDHLQLINLCDTKIFDNCFRLLILEALEKTKHDTGVAVRPHQVKNCQFPCVGSFGLRVVR